MEEVPAWALKVIEDIGETKGIVSQILIQTQKTNGRLTRVETITIPAIETRINELEGNYETNYASNNAKKTVWIQIAKFGGAVGGIILAAALGAWFSGSWFGGSNKITISK